MRYVYFTKSLQSLDIPGLIAFFKECGLDGADMAVRPEFPVTPANVREKLPDAAKQLRDAGLNAPPPSLKPGTFARVRIVSSRVDQVLTLPYSAMQYRYGVNRVFLVDGDHLAMRD